MVSFVCLSSLLYRCFLAVVKEKEVKEEEKDSFLLIDSVFHDFDVQLPTNS